jgi:hypothetical protein
MCLARAPPRPTFVRKRVKRRAYLIFVTLGRPGQRPIPGRVRPTRRRVTPGAAVAVEHVPNFPRYRGSSGGPRVGEGFGTVVAKRDSRRPNGHGVAARGAALVPERLIRTRNRERAQGPGGPGERERHRARHRAAPRCGREARRPARRRAGARAPAGRRSRLPRCVGGMARRSRDERRRGACPRRPVRLDDPPLDRVAGSR